MEVYFGLGSNQGDRLAHLDEALRELERAGARDVAVSPVVESPALLPAGAPADWNRPYLNLVARTRLPRAVDPDDWRRTIKSIESRLGRDLSASRWSPRPVDIDILLWGRRTIRTEHLTIPHPEILERSFVLTPLAHLAPRMTIPGQGEATVLEWSGRVRPIPLWMGVVNCTPDSFSGGGGAFDPERLAATVDGFAAAGAHWLDLGAESTRPGARPVSPEAEWARLEGPLREVLVPLSRRKAPSPGERGHPTPGGCRARPRPRGGHGERRLGPRHRADAPSRPRERRRMGGRAHRERPRRPCPAPPSEAGGGGRPRRAGSPGGATNGRRPGSIRGASSSTPGSASGRTPCRRSICSPRSAGSGTRASGCWSVIPARSGSAAAGHPPRTGTRRRSARPSPSPPAGSRCCGSTTSPCTLRAYRSWVHVADPPPCATGGGGRRSGQIAGL